KMPDDRGPGVVQHPLDYARRGVLVMAIRLVHGADALVIHHLRFEDVIVERVGFAVAGGERVGVDVNVLELATAGVEVPPVVDRPQMIFGKHRAQRVDLWNSRAGTGFGVESVASAATSRIAMMAAIDLVFGPVSGCDVFVGAGHFNAAFTAGCGLAGG